MSLKKMNAIVRIAIPLVLVITIVLFLFLNTWMNDATARREVGVELNALGSELLHNNDNLIKLVREFVVGFDEGVLSEYESLLKDTDYLDGKLNKMLDFSLSENERSQINQIFGILDELAGIEERAINAYNEGNRSEAAAIIQSVEYSTADLRFAADLKKLLVEINDRVAEEVGALTDRGRIGLIVIAIFFVLAMGAFALVVSWFSRKAYWYDDILDHIPFPISVTDVNRNATFLNKPGEDMLGVKRDKIIGKPCADVWKAGICGTPDCGLDCLNRGQTSTYFSAVGKDFKVEASYLMDTKGKKIGHIEAVMDLTEMLRKQKAEAELVKNIEQICVSVTAASKQIADGSHELAQESSGQATSIERLSSSISDIAQKTKNNAGMAGKAAALANTIKGNAEKGSHQMDEMMSAVKEINAASQSISRVISVIDSIAFQTNILALNAAVEAARAGQHGKGFAVVAEEVRNLASKSADAAKETSVLIQNSVEKAELGARIAEETAASLTEIVNGINESTLIVADIAKSSEEQTAGIEQINKGIDQVAQIVQQTSATAQQSAASSEEMSSQANMLEDLIASFKSGGTSHSRGLGGRAPVLPGRAPAPEQAGASQMGDGFGKY